LVVCCVLRPPPRPPLFPYTTLFRSVLLDEVVAALDPRPGDLIVDATFGAGGYTRAFLDAGATVHAFDRDPDAIAAGREWPETREDRKSTRLNSSHVKISYAVFCLKK